MNNLARQGLPSNLFIRYDQIIRAYLKPTRWWEKWFGIRSYKSFSPQAFAELPQGEKDKLEILPPERDHA